MAYPFTSVLWRAGSHSTLSVPWAFLQGPFTHKSTAQKACRGYLSKTADIEKQARAIMTALPWQHFVAGGHAAHHVVANVAVIEPDTRRIRNHIRRNHLSRGHGHNVRALAAH